MSRRSYAEEAQERLLRFWECDPEFGAPIGCLTTTFTFSASFFEEECLGRFVGVETDPREDGRAYLIEREERLSQVFAAVLVDQRHVSPYRSLRWHLLPVRLSGGGLLHAKVSLLAWESRIRILVGSANMTEPGYRRNLEHMGVVDFGPDLDTPQSILSEVVEFFDDLRPLIPGAHRGAEEGPHSRIKRFLRRVQDIAARWTERPRGRSSVRPHLLKAWPGRTGLFDQLSGIFPGRTGPNLARVVSPFFDADDGARRTVEALVSCMGRNGPRQIEFRAPGRVLEAGAESIVEVELPRCLDRPWLPRMGHDFMLVPERDESGEMRPLHAKSLWLQRGELVVFSIGSSNFTAAGTGLAGPHTNIEANLAYVMKSSSSRFARRCEAAYPPAQAVDPEREDVRFLRSSDRTPDAEASSLIPTSFGEALFEPTPDGGELRLEFVGDPPTGFEVTSPKGRVVTSDVLWSDAGRPEQIVIPWVDPRPPSYLTVSWVESADLASEVLWIVNVTDSSKLPPPDELREMSLEELLDILSSSRPIHEVMAAVLRRRESREGEGLPRPEAELDPHRRVDVQNFLIRRMRRVAVGLEGLRGRLERPAWNLDAFRWRLHGPVGPVALARRLASDEPEAAGFMLAEVALTVHRTDWSRVEAGIGSDATRVEVATVVQELLDLAERAPAPPNLAEYVREAFREIRP